MGLPKSERTPERLGYRSGYYGRTLITRVGKLQGALLSAIDTKGHITPKRRMVYFEDGD